MIEVIVQKRAMNISVAAQGSILPCVRNICRRSEVSLVLYPGVFV